MRSIGKQFSHTVRFQHEELVDAKSSTSKILPLVIVAVYLVTACHATLDLKYSCHVICLTLTSYSCHVICITSRWEILRYFFNLPPPLHPNGLLDRVLPPICSLSLPPPPRSSVLMSTCTYFCVRRKLKETILDCHSEFIRHHLLLVSQNYESFKHGMQNMGKVNELKYCILTLTNFPEAYNFFLRLFWETTLLIRHRINCSNSLC